MLSGTTATPPSHNERLDFISLISESNADEEKPSTRDQYQPQRACVLRQLASYTAATSFMVNVYSGFQLQP